MKIPTEATTEVEVKNFFEEAVRQGRAAKERYLLEVRQGLREANFNELRQLEMDIEKCEKELERMK